jgi:hypothetical protein
MARFTDLFRELPPRTALFIAGFSVSVLFVQAFIACCMAFQPGWANGLPVSKHSVFAAVMSGFVFTMAMSAGAGVFVIPCAYFERATKRKFAGWWAFLILILAYSLLAAFLSWNAYPTIRAGIAAEWP